MAGEHFWRDEMGKWENGGGQQLVEMALSAEVGGAPEELRENGGEPSYGEVVAGFVAEAEAAAGEPLSPTAVGVLRQRADERDAARERLRRHRTTASRADEPAWRTFLREGGEHGEAVVQSMFAEAA